MARYTAHREPRRSWQPEELAQLAREYPTDPTADIAERLGRHKSSIDLKAKQLGLRRGSSYKQKAPGRPKGAPPIARKPRTKHRNTFSTVPAAPTGADAAAILALWSETNARRFKNRAWERIPPVAVGFAVPVA